MSSARPARARGARTAIVVGGGIAGPVTAGALAKAGITATVHEAHPPVDPGIGGSLAIAPNGMAALDVLGWGDAVREHALPISSQRLTFGGRGGAQPPRLDDQEPQRMIGRGTLHRLLREAAAASGVEIQHGRRLVAVDERREGVTARFEDGSTASADLLVGADGVRSTVRGLIDPQAPGPHYTGMLGFEGRARGVDVGRPPGEMTFAFGRRAYYLYWAEPDGGTTWGANLPSPTYLSLTEARRTDDAAWLRVLADTYGGDDPGGALVAGTPPEDLQTTGALHIMPPVPHWYRGRMVLVGDAVHAPSNSTGQGASLAIESAVELAWCVRDVADVTDAFAAYERLRRPRVEKITRRGARLNSAKTPGPVGRALTSAILPLVLRLSNPDRVLGEEQRFRIRWEEDVART